MGTQRMIGVMFAVLGVGAMIYSRLIRAEHATIPPSKEEVEAPKKRHKIFGLGAAFCRCSACFCCWWDDARREPKSGQPHARGRARILVGSYANMTAGSFQSFHVGRTNHGFRDGCDRDPIPANPRATRDRGDIDWDITGADSRYLWQPLQPLCRKIAGLQFHSVTPNSR